MVDTDEQQELFEPPVGDIAARIQRILKPLSPSTAELLNPIKLGVTDRLHVSIDKDQKYFYLKAYADLKGTTVACSSTCSVKFFARLMEAEREASKHPYVIYSCAATDTNALILNAIWPTDKITFDVDADVLYTYLIARFMGGTENGAKRADYKINHIDPKEYEGFIEHPDENRRLTSYQKCGLFTDTQAYFMEQGTGKTPVLIAEICHKASKLPVGEFLKVAIVCPKNVRNNWLREYQSFATVPAKVAVIRGTFMERLRTITEVMNNVEDKFKAVILIFSYDGVATSWEMSIGEHKFPALSAIKFDLGIWDEAHYVKNPRTRRWEYAKKLRDNCKITRILTGTPITNSIMDLYTLFELLGEGESGFSTHKAYKSFYGVYIKVAATTGNGPSQLKLVDVQNLPFLQERMNRKAFLLTKAEALPDLPKKVYTIYDVPMIPIQVEWYNKMLNDLAIELQNMGSMDQVTANTMLVRMLRLAQITSGYLMSPAQSDPLTGAITSKPTVKYCQDIPPKVAKLLEIIKASTNNDKFIVWANWNADINIISKVLRDNNINYVVFTGSTSDLQRVEAEDRFNKQSAIHCKVFIGNAAAGGTGLNLRGYDPLTLGTDLDHGGNCSYVVYYSQGWSMVHRNQSEDRAHRRGTRVQVNYIDLQCTGTIDEQIRDAVSDKSNKAKSIQDLREIMLKVLETRPDIDDYSEEGVE